MTNTVVFGISALVVSYLAVYGIRLWAKQRDMLDIPNERSLHVRPTPVGGGLAIVGGLAFTQIGCQPISTFVPTARSRENHAFSLPSAPVT